MNMDDTLKIKVRTDSDNLISCKVAIHSLCNCYSGNVCVLLYANDHCSLDKLISDVVAVNKKCSISVTEDQNIFECNDAKELTASTLFISDSENPLDDSYYISDEKAYEDGYSADKLKEKYVAIVYGKGMPWKGTGFHGALDWLWWGQAKMAGDFLTAAEVYIEEAILGDERERQALDMINQIDQLDKALNDANELLQRIAR